MTSRERTLVVRYSFLLRIPLRIPRHTTKDPLIAERRRGGMDASIERTEGAQCGLPSKTFA